MTLVRRSDGSSLVELLISTALLAAVAAFVFATLRDARGLFAVGPEVADLQQRLRTAAGMLHSVLIMAGAGADAGHDAGPLHGVLAPVLPYRTADDVATGASPASDSVVVLYSAAPGAQVRVFRITASGRSLSLAVDPNCGSGVPDRLCGFEDGMRAVLFDASGRFELGTVAAVDALTLVLDAPVPHADVDVERHARLLALEEHAFWLDTAASDGVPRLVHRAGKAGFPVVDHAVGLRFEYFGDSRPPMLRPGADLDAPYGPWTTYGPPPPPAGTDDPRDSWPAGENCVFIAAGTGHAPRLPVLPGGRVVRLPLAVFEDGPWCPDANHPSRFDADLLRVRRVRVTLRVEVGHDAMRGQGPRFARPGAAGSAFPKVPDQEIRFDVSPRNLNFVP